MNVLMLVRRDAFRKPGGDTVQLMNTAAWLRRLGIAVRVRAGMPRDQHLVWAQIVHLFNTTDVKDAHAQMRLVRGAGKPLVLSTIYWNMEEYRFESASMAQRRWKLIRGILGKPLAFKIWRPRYRRRDEAARQQQLELLCAADVLLPNSQGEWALLASDFQLPKDKNFAIIPNGVETCQRQSSYFQERYALKDFVLCAARIEDRKNQHRLIDAIAPLKIPLVLIGLPNPRQPYYLQLCRERARRTRADVLLIPEHWSRDQLSSAYRAARVHALASWFDTPGLSSLEAGAAGCNVVSTNRGPTREYFRNFAWYCDPDSVDSIQGAIQDAFCGPRLGEHLREHILGRYTWKHAAELTALAYQRLLDSRRA